MTVILYIFKGQCFVALDPECFAPGFGGRLSELISGMKNLDLVSIHLNFRVENCGQDKVGKFNIG